MPYLISFAKWPSDKTAEVVGAVVAVRKKIPPDESLGEDIIPNAIKASENGIKNISVTAVSKGKLEEAYFHAQAVFNYYSMSIEGFEYQVEVWSNVEEAYSSIGQKPPE